MSGNIDVHFWNLTLEENYYLYGIWACKYVYGDSPETLRKTNEYYTRKLQDLQTPSSSTLRGKKFNGTWSDPKNPIAAWIRTRESNKRSRATREWMAEYAKYYIFKPNAFDIVLLRQSWGELLLSLECKPNDPPPELLNVVVIPTGAKELVGLLIYHALHPRRRDSPTPPGGAGDSLPLFTVPARPLKPSHPEKDEEFFSLFEGCINRLMHELQASNGHYTWILSKRVYSSTALAEGEGAPCDFSTIQTVQHGVSCTNRILIEARGRGIMQPNFHKFTGQAPSIFWEISLPHGKLVVDKYEVQDKLGQEVKLEKSKDSSLAAKLVAVLRTGSRIERTRWYFIWSTGGVEKTKMTVDFLHASQTDVLGTIMYDREGKVVN
ncbi:hypothetical protein T439DRAFT_176722 [Meredithblackwellia eburnea MCA 4105]